eukprot:TRINITY_DN67425_c0_g1_i1.p1 TRINITY_DN67425_c0_g1~~TRINITY_DN67425_c0_g1_i1.p1  ORF type:complete len:214 (-),score=19.84 TRINITY_DN67425_c0_g1_i1:146-787(-)
MKASKRTHEKVFSCSLSALVRHTLKRARRDYSVENLFAWAIEEASAESKIFSDSDHDAPDHEIVQKGRPLHYRVSRRSQQHECGLTGLLAMIDAKRFILKFCPVVKDTKALADALIAVMYEGIEKPVPAEADIEVQLSFDDFVRMFERVLDANKSMAPAQTKESRPSKNVRLSQIEKNTWAILYCGGSTPVDKQLREYGRTNNISYYSENFSW